jgi:hypothetical protein
LLAWSVGAKLANQLHGIAKPSYRNRLVGPFAAWVHLKLPPVHCLSRKRDMVGVRNKIKVDTPHHNNRFLAGSHASPLFLQTR